MSGLETAAPSEKIRAARASVASAIFLTLIKGVVGFLTGSLGILAEAAHSLLDLGAAGMTLFSVRYSDRPADAEHHYGHGKIENLSALAQTLLLIGTCLWISWEAIQRLFGETPHKVEATFWAFAVMVVSIGVDWHRARRLKKAARKFRSQALEADALHFSSDILSSLVVIVGLIGVRLGYPLADPIAAFLVAAWVVGISIRLGKRAIEGLLDSAPAHVREEVASAVQSVKGVAEVGGVRVREAGPSTFADITIRLDPALSLEQAHHLADEAEEAVRAVLPGADVVVHAEPAHSILPRPLPHEKSIQLGFESAAADMGIRFHSLRLFDNPEGLTAWVDVEFSPTFSLAQARERADQFEKAVLQRLPTLADVVAHIDIDFFHPDQPPEIAEAAPQLPDEASVESLVLDVPGVTGCHEIRFAPVAPEPLSDGHVVSPGHWASLHIQLAPELNVAQSHRIALAVERVICEKFPVIRRVHIHQEPTRLNSSSPNPCPGDLSAPEAQPGSQSPPSPFPRP